MARFWGAADRLFAAAVSHERAARRMHAAEGENDQELAYAYEEKSRAAANDISGAHSEARFLIAQMRLLYPDVATPADALRRASIDAQVQGATKETLVERQTALASYEAAARSLLQSE